MSRFKEHDKVIYTDCDETKHPAEYLRPGKRPGTHAIVLAAGNARRTVAGCRLCRAHDCKFEPYTQGAQRCACGSVKLNPPSY